jgi:hypothetical protein
MTTHVLQVDEMSAPRQPSAEYADAPVPEAAAKHLQLAAAMLGRAGSQGKLSQLAHLQLYDAVLLRQQKHAERLALLEDAQHGALMADEVARHRERAVLLERLGRYAEAQPLLASLLREHTPDAWATHAAHLRCALARTAAAEGGTAAEEAAGTVAAEEAAGTVRAEEAAGTVRTPLGEARELLAKLQLEHPTLRGPWLASLALELHALAPLAARELLGTAPGAVPGANPLAARELLGTAPDAPFGVAASVLAAAAAAAATAEAVALGARGGAGCAELVSQLQSYYKRYGDRPACVLDTAPCLRALRYVTAAQASLLELLEPQVLAESSASVVPSAVSSAAFASDDARDGAAHARVLCEVLKGGVRPPGGHPPGGTRHIRVGEQPLTKGRGAAAARAEHQGCGQAAPPRFVSPPLRFVSRPLRFVSRPLRFVSRRRRLWGVGGPLGAVQRAPQWASLQGRRLGAQDSASTTHGPGRRLGALPRLVLALSWAFRSVRRRGRYAPPAGRARAQHGARTGARYGAQPLAHGGESASDGGGGLRGVIRGHQRSS